METFHIRHDLLAKQQTGCIQTPVYIKDGMLTAFIMKTAGCVLDVMASTAKKELI